MGNRQSIPSSSLALNSSNNNLNNQNTTSNNTNTTTATTNTNTYPAGPPTSSHPLHDGVSLRALDGKASIEHLISIHVQDLIDLSTHPEFSLNEILAGLRYLMDYRIHGGKMPNLDLPIMIRLLDAFLLHMRHTTPSFLGSKKKFTFEANEAFTLFVQFTLEVEEARIALAEKPVAVLRHTLALHKRYKEPNLQCWVQCCLKWYPTWSSQITDWKELVEASSIDSIQPWYESTLTTDFTSSIPFLPSPPPLNKRQIYPPPGLYFDRTIQKVSFMFKTHLESGLDLHQVEEYQAYYGVNQLPLASKPAWYTLLLLQFWDFMMMVLLIVAIIEFATQEYNTAGILVLVVFINALIGFTQEWKANVVLDSLNKLSVPSAKVIRQGTTQLIPATHLVPGDLVVLEEGDRVPADLRITQSHQLEIVEAILTGESIGIPKSSDTIRYTSRRLPLTECKANAFMSTFVSKGRGQGIVVRIGSETEMGKISKAITSTPTVSTPIQKKLKTLGFMLVLIAFGLCALVVILGLSYQHDPMEMVKIGISLAVSVIPEGLVTVVTVTMAVGVQRMAKQQAIVRKLPSVETLGSVTTICSDKTGTLTEGKMGAQALWTVQQETFTFTEPTVMDPTIGAMVASPSSSSSSSMEKGGVSSKSASSSVSTLAIQICALCNNATLTPSFPEEDQEPWIHPPVSSTPPKMESLKTTKLAPQATNKESIPTTLTSSSSSSSSTPTPSPALVYKPIGDPTEVALVLASERAKLNKQYWESKGWTRVCENAFDSDRKVMSVVYTIPSTSTLFTSWSPYMVFAKGAPEAVLQRCTSFSVSIEPTWQTQPFNESIMQLISDQASVMASQGLRVLGLACSTHLTSDDAKETSNAHDDQEPPTIPTSSSSSSSVPSWSLSAMESNWTFVGLIGLMDPPRKGVKESVALCHQAGIQVIMITGDHITTAVSIATQLGVMDTSHPLRHRAIRGAELELIPNDQLSQLHPFPTVFARVSPDHKLKIVQALQKRQQLVAMTGDGVNDAPAIKAADVGVAMGLGGTDITKQAADIVLANDDFNTIVQAIQEGRRVFDNISKFMVYLLSCNSAEIWLMLLAAAMNRQLPFTTMVILWANIIADVPPAMALGMELPEPKIMDRPPRSPTAGVIDPMALVSIWVQGWSMTLISFTLYLLGSGASSKYGSKDLTTLQLARSTTFAALTTLQLVQGMVSRSTVSSIFQFNVLGNPYMLVAIAFSFSCLVMGFYIPGLAQWLELVPINGWEWGKIAIGVVIHVLVTEILKFGLRFWKHRSTSSSSSPSSSPPYATTTTSNTYVHSSKLFFWRRWRSPTFKPSHV